MLQLDDLGPGLDCVTEIVRYLMALPHKCGVVGSGGSANYPLRVIIRHSIIRRFTLLAVKCLPNETNI